MTTGSTHKRLRARIVCEFEYLANPEHYGTDDPHRMAAIDQQTIEGDGPAAYFDAYTYTVEVEPVE